MPVDGGLALLDRLVAEGRAEVLTRTDPIPLPPVLGDPNVNAADQLAAREDERW